MKFIVYDLTTGEVLRRGQCQPGDLHLQVRPGQGVIEDDPEASIYTEVDLDALRAAVAGRIGAGAPTLAALAAAETVRDIHAVELAEVAGGE